MVPTSPLHSLFERKVGPTYDGDEEDIGSSAGINLLLGKRYDDGMQALGKQSRFLSGLQSRRRKKKRVTIEIRC